ncbi:MAG: AAA family ATPase [Methylacidiphilales bacterium]|nr:AAA family ATPase [Candidatus Methylacidiphilales bacterium]
MANSVFIDPPAHRPELALLNTITPRIFVAATRMDDGKTTTAVGLFAALQQRFPRIGYIKPVGQRFVDIEGTKIDEDTVLINDTYHPRTPLKAMSPITVEPDFTRRYLSGGITHQLHDRVRAAFDEAAWEKDFVIIEGTGHAGVGSVFDLSNAMVAKLLQAKVIIVSRAGIGRPIDEICLNMALFEKFGVEVIGAIINKVVPGKMAMLKEYATLGLAKVGLPLLGMIPLHTELYKPTVNQVCQQLRGEFIAGSQHKRRRVGRIGIGAMSSRHAEHLLIPGTLVVTPGDREDLIMMVLNEDSKAATRGYLAGVVLTNGILPHESVMELIRQRSLPFVSTRVDVSNATTTIARMTVKTEIGDRDKIGLIQKLIQDHVQVDRIVDLVQRQDPNAARQLNLEM